MSWMQCAVSTLNIIRLPKQDQEKLDLWLSLMKQALRKMQGKNFKKQANFTLTHDTVGL